MPNAGSGKTLFFTCAANTVLGTVTAYQPLGWNCGVERTSPVSPVLAEDCRAQPSRKLIVFSGWLRLADSCANRRAGKNNSSNMPHKLRIFMMAPGLFWVSAGRPLCRAGTHLACQQRKNLPNVI